jgi:type I restriction enzyme, S subunit
MIAEKSHMKTELKVVPKLRFGEFGVNFSLNRVGELCDSIVPGRNKPKDFNGNIPWITTPDIKHNGRVFFSTNNLNVTEEEAKRVGAKIIPINSIIFSCVGEIGLTAITGNKMVINQQLHTFIPKEKIDVRFLMYNIGRQKRYFNKVATKTSVPYMNKESCNSIPIYYPSLPEQQKIASFLSAVDEKLQQLTKKKDLLQEYKKGVMQKIFSQELRFKDDNGNNYPHWEEKKLGKLCKITTGKLDANAMVKGGQYRFYTCAKDYYQIDRYEFDTDALIISGNGANVGYVHHFNGKFNAYQRTYVLDNFEDSIYYLRHFLDRHLYKRIFREKKDGATPYIVMSTLSDMIILLPTLDEQKKIANFLSAIDDKISLVSTQIENAKAFKKGLLQQMFV